MTGEQFGCFEEFYRSQLTRLVGLLLRNGATREDAMDVAQEVMIAVHLRWTHIQSPSAYAYAAATRVFARAVRGMHTAWVTPMEDMDTEFGLLDNDESDRADVLALLAELPARQRQIMALHYDGFAPGEIAGMLGVDPNNVRVNLHHARVKLRERIRSYLHA